MIEYFLTHSPALIVAIPLLGAFLTPLISRVNDKLRNLFAIIILGLTGFFVALLGHDVLINGNLHVYIFGAEKATLPIVRILYEIDALSAFMAIIIIFIAFIATIFSWFFMEDNTGLDKYYTLVLLMTAGALGMVLTGDLFNFFVFLEITSISSCALIAFWTDRKRSIDAGFKYIVISAIGALFVLLSIALLYAQYDALNIAVLASSIKFSFVDKIALIILIAALAMKAGIVPMHMWLPDAYGRAPASISIMLVTATMASLYGIFRVVFTLYGGIFSATNISFLDYLLTTNILGGFLIILAILTILIGVIMALKQSNLKRLIAFAALAEIGYMLLGLGIRLASKMVVYDINGTPSYLAFPDYSITALTGSIFHMLNDAMDIGLLFLVAGAIYYATRETSLDKLGGLARKMKYTTIFFLMGLLAVSGMPPMNGFASKLIIYETAYQLSPLISIVAILSSILLLAVFVKVFHSAFLGPEIPRLKNVKEVPKSMLIAMGIIACLIIFFGLFPNFVIENMVQPAVQAILNNASYIGGVI